MIRAYADNVIIVLEPLPTQSAGGLHLPQQASRGARGSRTARVIASGPGHHRQRKGGANSTTDGAFVPNETKPGDRVLVDAAAGQDYAMDITVPRHNKSHGFEELFGDRGEFRIIREAEVLGILENG